MNVSATRPAVRITSSTADDCKGEKTGKLTPDASHSRGDAPSRQIKVQSNGVLALFEKSGRAEMTRHRKGGALTETMGQVAAMQGLSVWVYKDDSIYETRNADDAWTSSHGVHASPVASERGTNATRGEEKGGTFGGTLRMA
jgi:hypothetical protein